MTTIVNRRVRALESKVAIAGGRLNAVSPLATLQRGYAIVSNAEGHVVTDANTLRVGDIVKARVAEGRVTARVESIDPNDSANTDQTR